MSDETKGIEARTLAALDAMGLNTDDLQTAVMDAVANLLILAHEREMNVADVVVDGAAHYCATYMEPMDAGEAEAWLHEALFPFSGEQDFEWYIAMKAIVRSGHAGKVDTPEYGV